MNTYYLQNEKVLYQVLHKCEPKFINLTVNQFNSSVYGTLLNANFETFKRIDNVWCDLELKVPESTEDQMYRRTLFKSNLNFLKLMNGSRGNNVITSFYQSLTKSFDFEFKLPLKPVNIQF